MSFCLSLISGKTSSSLWIWKTIKEDVLHPLLLLRSIYPQTLSDRLDQDQIQSTPTTYPAACSLQSSLLAPGDHSQGNTSGLWMDCTEMKSSGRRARRCWDDDHLLTVLKCLGHLQKQRPVKRQHQSRRTLHRCVDAETYVCSLLAPVQLLRGIRRP